MQHKLVQWHYHDNNDSQSEQFSRHLRMTLKSNINLSCSGFCHQISFLRTWYYSHPHLKILSHQHIEVSKHYGTLCCSLNIAVSAAAYSAIHYLPWACLTSRRIEWPRANKTNCNVKQKNTPHNEDSSLQWHRDFCGYRCNFALLLGYSLACSCADIISVRRQQVLNKTFTQIQSWNIQQQMVCYVDNLHNKCVLCHGYMRIKLFWNNSEIISVLYFTCNHVQNWNEITSAAEGVPKLFQNFFQRQWTCWKIFVSCNEPVK